ncbi:MAG TPA: hypothetical protein VMB71_05640, partial [Acetobacteraceae bacterium]|nr:hypothetical protein [Acetobacteraceae bacterium]
MNQPGEAPKRRQPLRALLYGIREAAQAAQAELQYQPAADASGNDRDVLLGYQIFLGRDPENSFVITGAKMNPLRAFLQGLMASSEFQSGVAT